MISTLDKEGNQSKLKEVSRLWMIDLQQNETDKISDMS